MFSRTQRLLLRPGWAEDAAALHNAWNDDAIARNMLDLPAVRSEASARAFLEQDRGELSPYFLMFARTGGAPRLVGGCGINAHPHDAGVSELTVWIARPFWGLGFATEAAAAVTEMARAAGIHNLVARPTIDNKAATHVLRKLGFRPTGRIEKRHSPARDGAVSCTIFEDSGVTPMAEDSALELYMDRAPIAA